MIAEELLRAAAENHRPWFWRRAGARGGHLERVGGTELVVTPGDGVIPFPRVDMNAEEVVDPIRILGLRNVGCWSLAPDSRLGTSLVARGFGWGRQPRWMGLDLRHLTRDPPDHQVRAACAPYAGELPYPPSGPEPVPSLHLGVRSDGLTVGHIVMAPWHGVAGIYSMGVDPGYRRHGIGRALTIAACRLAAAGWLLERRPGLASLRFEPFGGTLLHLAVERNKPAFIELGLVHGVDPRARDGTWNSTAIEWAQHFKNAQIGELLTGRRAELKSNVDRAPVDGG